MRHIKMNSSACLTTMYTCSLFLGHFDGNAMPSAGALPFVQSFLCNFNNPCHSTVTEDENPGTIGSFQQSL